MIASTPKPSNDEPLEATDPQFPTGRSQLELGRVSSLYGLRQTVGQREHGAFLVLL